MLATTCADAFFPVVVQSITPGSAPLTHPILNAGRPRPPICPAVYLMYAQVTQNFAD